jgi:hypothetical protein
MGDRGLDCGGLDRVPSWVIRSAPPFSWGEVESPSVAFDYVLLLGLLLFASDLAYVEAQFTLLGPRWVHHLLVVASVYVVAAYRWDSRGRPEPGAQHARGLAWRVGQRDGPLAGSGRRQRAACETPSCSGCCT